MMKKNLLLSILFNLIACNIAWAAQLQAEVSPATVNRGDSVELRLSLTDSQQDAPVAEPDLTPLQDLFVVQGQQQSQSMQVINGHVTRQLIWSYQLQPLQTGRLIIPPLSLQTKTEVLRSQPVVVNVSNQVRPEDAHFKLETSVSIQNPYLYQPFYYTLRLYHRNELRNAQFDLPEDGVLRENIKLEPISKRQVVNGEAVIATDITYLMTPIRPGKLTLPASKIIAQKQQNTRRRFGGLGGGFFNFNTPRTVTIVGEPLTLDIRPPASADSPWLPAQRVTLENNWESDIQEEVQLGTPLIRTLTLTVKGAGTQTMPDLSAFVPDSDTIRVRSPKPKTERDFLSDGKTLQQRIQHTFSITPQQAGTLTLPAIRLPWWNVQTDQLMWVEIPMQTLQVAPNPLVVTAPAPQPVTHTINTTHTAAAPGVIRQSVELVAFNTLQYVLFTIVVVALLMALVLGRLQQGSQAVPVAQREKTLSAKQQLNRLSTAETCLDLKQAVQAYAQARWSLPAGASLQRIANEIIDRHESDQAIPLRDLLKQLETQLYGEGATTFDVVTWRTQAVNLFKQLRARPLQNAKQDVTLMPLNPA